MILPEKSKFNIEQCMFVCLPWQAFHIYLLQYVEQLHSLHPHDHEYVEPEQATNYNKEVWQNNDRLHPVHIILQLSPLSTYSNIAMGRHMTIDCYFWMPYWILGVWEWLKETQLCQNKKSKWCKIISGHISNSFIQYAKIHHLKLLPVWQEQKLVSFMFVFGTQTGRKSQYWPMGNFLKGSILIWCINECKIWPKTILHWFDFVLWQSWVFLSLSQSLKIQYGIQK